MRTTLLTLVLLAAAVPAAAQAPADAGGRGQFAAATIRINLSGDARSDAQISPGGRVVITNTTIQDLVRTIFGLAPAQIAGGPDWLTRERYDIVATANGDVTRPQVAAMLQSLLAERLELAYHFEARRRAAYALRPQRPDRLGPGIRPAAECAAACGFDLAGGSLAARGMSMASLAQRLAAISGRTVIDETGLAGLYDLQLTWSPDSVAGVGDAPSLFTALREQLGLRLEDAETAVQVLVIDRIERPAPE